MAEVNTGDGGGGHGKHEKKRAKKSSTRIDMTPMVDLAFLLLTFFVLTSTFNKPKTMEINFPAKKPENQKDQLVNNALTFILTKEGAGEKEDGLYYYYGQFYAPNNPQGKPVTTFERTNFSKDGLHKILLDRNKPTIDKINELEGKYKRREIADTTYKRLAIAAKGDVKALTVLIKADDKAVYKNVIDAIDELNICNVGKYAIVDMSQPELDILNTIKKK
ncbi:MAG TPA: biopolymer transporter ExbD [Bacteroidia bacterium]|jgi:biopolymer transport protein ExbD|nr:biopolymer transporter ExbD [Bacteroidia bacterium]